MEKRQAIAAVLFAAVTTLSACGGSSDSGGGSDTTAPTPHAAGIIRISVDGLGTPHPVATAANIGPPASQSTGGPQARVLSTQPCFLQIQGSPIDSGAFNTASQQYAAFTFLVRNAQGVSGNGCTAGTANGALSNVTLVGLVEPGFGINGTPFISLKKFDGSNEPASIATTILPTHGMVFNPLHDAAEVQVGAESLQVFSEAQIAGIAIDPEDVAGSYLLPYGFVVHNVNPALGRTLQANPQSGEFDGQFTFAVKLPTPASKVNAVYAFQFDLQVLTDSTTRVTQSPEEQNPLGDLAANLRAATLGSTDLAVLGGSHVTASNIGDPICTVRSAGPAAGPTAYLVNAGSSPNVASAPYNLSGIAPSANVNTAFCQPMTFTNVAAGFVVNSSESVRAAIGTSYILNGGNLSYGHSTPFFAGEKVDFSLTNLLTSSGNTHPAPFVGSFYVGGVTPSDAQFRNFSTTGTGTTPSGVAVADFDHDGIADMAIVNAGNNSIFVYYGNGDGTYGAPSAFSTGTAPSAVVAGDFNNDGYADLAITNATSNNVTILLNQAGGTRNFIAASGSPVTVGTKPVAIAAADFNNDGKLDLAVANFSSNTVTVLFGSGTGTFSGGTIGVSGPTGFSAIGTGRFHGGSNIDIVVAAQTTNQVFIAIGNGTGGFSVAGSNLAGSAQGVGTTPVALAIADFNGDGIPDVATANSGSNNWSVLFGNGTGGLTGGTGICSGLSGADGIAVGDIDGDGKQDLVVANATSNQACMVYGNGSGGFTVGPDYTVGTAPGAVAVADLNGDGAADTVILNKTGSTYSVLLGNNTRVMSAPSAVLAQGSAAVPTSGIDVVEADFNGDGKLDVAVTNSGGGNVSILLGDGAGHFTAAPGSPVTVGATPYHVVAADFDGDGKIDLAVVNRGSGTVTLLKGSGTGSFTSQGSISVGASPAWVTVGDFNGDGRPDLAVSNQGATSVSILLNTGSFGFSSNTTGNAVLAGPWGVETADFNGDGKLDLAVSNSNGGSVSILLGDGAGNFNPAPTTSYSVGAAPDPIAVGDVNGDGCIDVIAGSYLSNTVSVLLGNCAGGFAAAQTYNVGINPFGIRVRDLDGDGVADLAVVNFGSHNVSLLLGSKSGTLTPAQGSPLAVRANPGGVAVGDFFGTHKLGMVVTSYTNSLVSVVPQK